MRITVLTHYYPPEVNAPASRISELARAWRDMGHAVTIVTTAPSHPRGVVYPGFRNRFFQHEVTDGIEVIRLWTAIAANEGFLRRLLGYLSYPLSLALNLGRIPRSDIVISTSPQFFCGLAGYLLQSQRRPWILEIRDLWPESIVTVGAMRQGPVIRLLEKIEAWAYRKADGIVSVTDSFVPHLRARAPNTPIAVVKNGVDLALFGQRQEIPADLIAEHGLGGKFVAGYIGTHGMAHGLDTVLEAAELLRHRPDIAFLLIGDGAQRARLQAQAADRGLTNVIFAGQQPKAAMPGIWSSLGASLVLLKRMDTFKSVLPSKMFEAMAMESPIILGVEGEAAALLAEAGAGIAITPEDSAALAATVCRLADEPARAADMGKAGRTFVARHFDRRRLAEDYLAFVQHIVGKRAQ